MRMRLEAELGLGAHTLNHPGEASGGDGAPRTKNLDCVLVRPYSKPEVP